MSLSLIVNSNNVQTDGYNTHFVYKFINGSLNIPEGTEMAISNVTIPYSWFNLNSQVYNNTTLVIHSHHHQDKKHLA